MGFLIDASLYGTGADGDIIVDFPNTVVNTFTDLAGTQSETANADVVKGATRLLVRGGAGFTAGDEILILQTQAYRHPDNIGCYELKKVAAVGSWINSNGYASAEQHYIDVSTPLANSYYSDNDGNTAQCTKTQVVRVPNFNSVIIAHDGSGTVVDTGYASITTPAWNGYTGGVVAFRAKTRLNALNNGNIVATRKGYRGTYTLIQEFALTEAQRHGEGYCGHGAAGYNANGYAVENFGGGGYLSSAGHRYAGGNISPWYVFGGRMYGDARCVNNLTMGGGGGILEINNLDGGGGIILIAAKAINTGSLAVGNLSVVNTDFFYSAGGSTLVITDRYQNLYFGSSYEPVALDGLDRGYRQLLVGVRSNPMPELMTDNPYRPSAYADLDRSRTDTPNLLVDTTSGVGFNVADRSTMTKSEVNPLQRKGGSAVSSNLTYRLSLRRIRDKG